MSSRFEELDWQETPIGAISLRRRRDPALKVDVFEVKIDDEFLMSSLFTAGEVELARLGLAAVSPAGADPAADLDVVVGGLGLGYTARAALADPRVGRLLVVELLDEVISWHRRGLLPLAAELTDDPRTRLVRADFFAAAADPAGFDPDAPGRRFHAILLDVDHTPSHVLHPSHAALYTTAGLRRMATHLHPGGVFALWSDDPPDPATTTILSEVFTTVAAHVVSFPNPVHGGTASNTVYVAHGVDDER